MTRTDRIIDATVKELERRRVELDADPHLQRVEIAIKFDGCTGEPKHVICRRDSHSYVEQHRVRGA